MSKKEIKLHMGFMDENGNLVEIPQNIQKHIEAREEFWANKIKDIDSKCGIVLERLALTEKALELMAKSVWPDGTSCMKFLDTGIQVNSQVEYLEYFKTKAKEMMSDNGEQI